MHRGIFRVALATSLIASCAGGATPAAPSSAGAPAPSVPRSATTAPTFASSATASPPSPSVTDRPTPAATIPAQNGSIAFVRSVSGTAQIWTACPDLSHAKQLTSVPNRDSGGIAWSPDGSRIAFDSNRDDPDPNADPFINDVYVMDRDGAGVRKLTKSIGLSGGPSYSPDGRLIAFESDRGEAGKEGIYLMEAADGSGVRRLTTALPGKFDQASHFSPDGKRLVFTRTTSDSSAELVVVNLDGSGLRSITPGDLAAGDAKWSPDGPRIVFEAYPPQYPRGSAWIVAPDGSGLKNLTDRPAGAEQGFADPVWSPDGSLILLLHGLFASDGSSTGGLATMHPDGTGLRYVADGRGEEHGPDWASAPDC
jgi:Tol biopolymer transport system component